MQPDIMRECDYYFMNWQFCMNMYENRIFAKENKHDSNHDPILTPLTLIRLDAILNSTRLKTRLWGIDLQSLQWHALYKGPKSISTSQNF